MKRFAGMFPVLQTPFDESAQIDLDSLRAVVAFCLQAGAHGLVTPANGSEFFTLSDAERMRVTEAVLEEAGGRVPVIISVSGVSTPVAVSFARHAIAHGADGIMAVPPYVRRPPEPGIFSYYEALADAAEGRPLIIQNAESPMGTPLSIGLLVRLLERIPTVSYVKEEVMPAGQRITALLRAAGDRLRGIFGGWNALWLLNEMDRGACGNMPGCGLIDVHVQIYRLYSQGKRTEAETLSLQLLPLLNLGRQYGVACAKELLWRRGVIRTKVTRDPNAAPLDDIDIRELQRFWERVQPVHSPTL